MYYGTNIQTSGDNLQKIEIHQIFNKIKNPSPEFRSKITQLREVKLLDRSRYNKLKVTLPYFCCGVFSPSIRKKEYFMSIQYFVLDLDYIPDAGLEVEVLKTRLKQDDSVLMMFESPGCDGLKILFQLSEPIYEAGIYSHFYKAFCVQFSGRYELDKVLDVTTHDVSRATFFSYDDDIYFNPLASKVSVASYISEELDSGYFEVEKQFKKLVDEATPSIEDQKSVLDDEILENIKKKINPNFVSRREKNKAEIIIPHALTEIEPAIRAALEASGLEIVSITPIQYAKRIRVKIKHLWAEINVFYGQKGFSVVPTTKTGSDKEVGRLAYQIIDSVVFGI